MGKLGVGFIIGLLVALVLPVLAGNNDVIRACSDFQMSQIVTAFRSSDFALEYGELNEQIKAGIDADTFGSLLQMSSKVQSSWWTEVVPGLPDCALAVRFTLAGGRPLDELTIALGLGLSAVDEANAEHNELATELLTRAQHHLAQWTGAQDAFTETLQEILDATQ